MVGAYIGYAGRSRRERWLMMDTTCDVRFALANQWVAAAGIRHTSIRDEARIAGYLYRLLGMNFRMHITMLIFVFRA